MEQVACSLPFFRNMHTKARGMRLRLLVTPSFTYRPSQQKTEQKKQKNKDEQTESCKHQKQSELPNSDGSHRQSLSIYIEPYTCLFCNDEYRVFTLPLS